MKLIKDVIVRGSDGKEINKTDVGKTDSKNTFDYPDA